MSNLDNAYERFLLVDFEYGGGFANHGPMAVEALESIGHQALIPAFVDSYAPRLPLARTGRAPGPDALGAALGDPERAPDWVAHFEQVLASDDWLRVAISAVCELLPGMSGAAGHGLLRTMHALRALEREDTPIRRRELARGLAYWSANFRSLPGEPGRCAARSGPAGAVVRASPARVLHATPVLTGARPATETFVESMCRLDGEDAFRAAIESVALPDGPDVDAFLAATCRAAAALYLAHPEARIGYVHAVTIPSAMRWLARRLEPAAARRGAGYAIQTAAAFHAVLGASPVREKVDDDVARAAQGWDEVRYRAACSLEEHAVKLAEACWREDQLGADPIFRLAAADAALRLEGNPAAAR